MQNGAQHHSPQEAFLPHGFIQSGAEFSSPLSQNQETPPTPSRAHGNLAALSGLASSTGSPHERPCAAAQGPRHPGQLPQERAHSPQAPWWGCWGGLLGCGLVEASDQAQPPYQWNSHPGLQKAASWMLPSVSKLLQKGLRTSKVGFCTCYTLYTGK